MKLEHSPNADAAYISLLCDEDPRRTVAFTYCCDSKDIDGMINLDFDDSGRLVGIEILPASKILPEYLLKNQWG